MKMILIGDSIRMGYQPLVTAKLKGRADVVGPVQNGGDSHNVLTHMESWVLSHEADVVHMNCGLHDLKFENGRYQVPLDEYVRNVEEIVRLVQERFGGRFIWATTTPVLDERHQKVKPFERHETDVQRYNEAALAVMRAHKVTVNDLHAVIENGGPAECLGPDGVHMTERGNALLSEAVAAAILAPR